MNTTNTTPLLREQPSYKTVIWHCRVNGPEVYAIIQAAEQSPLLSTWAAVVMKIVIYCHYIYPKLMQTCYQSDIAILLYIFICSRYCSSTHPQKQGPFYISNTSQKVS